MRGNSIGKNLVLTSFGESHGTAIGAVIDGVPAGIPLNAGDIAQALSRRRPGQSDITTARNEPDEPELLSGVFEGRTLGTPVAVIVRNTAQRSEDYSPDQYRPGHADKVWEDKYGIRDYRGGGRASGRETIARVVAGAVAEKILPPGVRIVGYTQRVGPVVAGQIPPGLTRNIVDAHPTRCPDPGAAEEMQRLIAQYKEDGDSLGGTAIVRASGVPAGLGEPVFHKVKSALAAAITSVGAVAGIMFGVTEDDLELPGSVFHEELAPGIARRSYGIQGGITNGEDIVLRVYVKPPSTTGDAAKKGRHDPCLLPRIVPVLEAMTAFTLADLYLGARLDRMERP
jgi:chorismate synthase